MASMEEPKIAPITTHIETVEDKKIPGKHIDGSALLVSKEGSVRKLPVPSNDPNDPLNWSVRLSTRDVPHQS